MPTTDSFRCTHEDFYVALDFSRGLALLVWVGGGLLKRVLYFFSNEPSLGQRSAILHLPPQIIPKLKTAVKRWNLLLVVPNHPFQRFLAGCIVALITTTLCNEK